MGEPELCSTFMHHASDQGAAAYSVPHASRALAYPCLLIDSRDHTGGWGLYVTCP